MRNQTRYYREREKKCTSFSPFRSSGAEQELLSGCVASVLFNTYIIPAFWAVCACTYTYTHINIYVYLMYTFTYIFFFMIRYVLCSVPQFKEFPKNVIV